MADEDGLLTLVLIVVGAIVLLPLLIMLFAMPIMAGWGGHWDGLGWFPFGTWWTGGTSWIVLLIVAGVIIYLVTRDEDGSATADDDRALEELRMAYARGDLSDEEFERRRQRLRED